MHGEVRNVLFDLGCHMFRRKAHGGDVERVAVDESGRIRFHELDDGIEGVRHVHHVHVGAFLNEAGIRMIFQGFIIDVNRVVGGSAAGQRDIGNEAGEADTAGVDAILFKVVVTQQLAGYLGNSVHCRRTLQGVLRRVHLGGAGSEGADGGRGEEMEVLLPGQFQRVDQTAHVDGPRQLGLGFSNCRQQSRQVDQGVRIVLLHDLGHHFGVRHIENLEGSAGAGDIAFIPPDIRGDDFVGSVYFS